MRYLNLRPIFFCHMGKWLDKKVNFKVYDVQLGKQNDYNTTMGFQPTMTQFVNEFAVTYL